MKTVARTRRHQRVRRTVRGTAARPRLVVFRGSRTMSVQLVDDEAGQGLLTLTTKQSTSHAATTAAAAGLGEQLAKSAKMKKIERVVFDRAGYQYHGKVKALAEAARKGGLVF